MTEHSSTDDILIALIIDAFLQDKGKGVTGESDTYRLDAARDLDRFIEWLREEALGRDPTFGDLDERTFRRYAPIEYASELDPLLDLSLPSNCIVAVVLEPGQLLAESDLPED